MSYNYRTPIMSGSSGTIMFLLAICAIVILGALVFSGTFLLNSKSEEDECLSMGNKDNLVYAKSSSGECYSTGCKPGFNFNEDGDCV